MAILAGCSGLACAITVNGRNLLEYDDPEASDGRQKTTKYVEVETDSRFEILTRFDSTTFPYADGPLKLSLYMDGQFICVTTVGTEIVTRSRKHSLERTVRREGKRTYLQYFKFAALNITEDAPNKALFGKLGKLGTVEVKYRRGHVIGPNQPTLSGKPYRQVQSNNNASYAQPLLKDDTVAEKALKGRAISHQARIEEVRIDNAPLPTAQVIRPRLQATGDGPIAMFCFKYRSKSALQALHVVPRSPPPVPLEDRDIDGLSPEELRELLQRQQDEDARNAKDVKYKREREMPENESDIEDDEDDIVERCHKKLRTGADCVIDLCEDD